MIAVALFDAFFVAGGAFAATRCVQALLSGVAQYQTGRFSRNENPATFWIVVVGYLALVFGSVYGMAVGAGL